MSNGVDIAYRAAILAVEYCFEQIARSAENVEDEHVRDECAPGIVAAMYIVGRVKKNLELARVERRDER